MPHTRPALVPRRVSESMTPIRGNRGESHEISAEKSTEIMAVSTSAPRMTESAECMLINPCPTNDAAIKDVAVLDWMTAVTPAPANAAEKRLLRLWCSQ